MAAVRPSHTYITSRRCRRPSHAGSRGCRSSPTCTAPRSCCWSTSTGCAGWPGCSAPTSPGWRSRAARGAVGRSRRGGAPHAARDPLGAVALRGPLGAPAAPRGRMSSRIVAISPTCATTRGACWTCRPSGGVDSERGRHRALRPPRFDPRGAAGSAGGNGSSRSRRAGTSRAGRASIRYGEEDMRWFGPGRDHAPVLMFVGRFTEVKRVPAAAARLRACARAVHDSGAARPLGRLHRRMGGRAPYAVAREVGEEGHLLRRVARAHGAARGPRRAPT